MCTLLFKNEIWLVRVVKNNFMHKTNEQFESTEKQKPLDLRTLLMAAQEAATVRAFSMKSISFRSNSFQQLFQISETLEISNRVNDEPTV